MAARMFCILALAVALVGSASASRLELNGITEVPHSTATKWLTEPTVKGGGGALLVVHGMAIRCLSSNDPQSCVTSSALCGKGECETYIFDDLEASAQKWASLLSMLGMTWGH